MTYEEMRTQMTNVSAQTQRQLTAICQQNPWLRRGGIPFEDDPLLELDSPFSFWQTESLDSLEAFFAHGNWAIRNGVVFHDLAFINQVNGGDEWWTLKRFGGEWLPFESVTFGGIIRRGDFHSFLQRLELADYEQCKTLSY